MSDTPLYPTAEPYRTHQLPVSDGHTLWIEESGNPQGIPVVVLHGGPGGGMSAGQRATFDPDAYRVILFDQRGCGRSTPHASLHANTTQALIADLETLRQHLGIERWLVAGGSWGSCLGLAYGQAHPDRCLGFRLHGIFMMQPTEVAWWFQDVRAIFPDHWEAFADFVTPEERHDLVHAYHRRLTGDDPALAQAAAISLRTFSARTQTLIPDEAHVARLTRPDAALAVSRLFTHYCVNGGFLPPGQLLRDVPRLRHLPAEIVQGRYDTVTPPITAWALHKAWPEARFTLVAAANHVSTAAAPDLNHALRAAADRLRDTLRPSQAT